jgi:hypothetical protein
MNEFPQNSRFAGMSTINSLGGKDEENAIFDCGYRVDILNGMGVAATGRRLRRQFAHHDFDLS